MKKELFFKPRASLLLQLGDQLIKNENIAIVELIKNSYDADATLAKVILDDLDKPMLGKIIIEDNGCGMSLDVVENVWLEPGNAHKKSIIINKEKSALGRYPIGEKGIGRFGVHKLGRIITMTTKSKNSNEVVVNINWENFLNAKYLNDVKIEVIERKPEVFVGNKTGTVIEISKLNVSWDKTKYEELIRALQKFNSPFNKSTDFKIEIQSNMTGWLNKILTFDEIKEFALYHYKSTITQDSKEIFTYEFLPFKNMEIAGRTKEGVHDLTDKDGNNYYTGDHKLGNIDIELYCFDRDNDIIKKYLTADKKQFKDYLDYNGGVYVFRDGLRVYDYGEKENDWLGLDHARFNQPASKISNNIIIAAVSLNRIDSVSLIEKSNREGFVENAAYNEFKALICESINNFLSYRNADKAKLRSNNKKKKEPIIEDIYELKAKIDILNLPSKDKKDIILCLNRIEKDYLRIKEVNLLTSTAGMSYGIVIHEIEKIMKEISLKIITEPSSAEFKNSIYHLSEIIQSYSNLIRQKQKENCSLMQLIKQSKFNCDYRLKAHNIDLIIDNSTDHKVECSYNLIVGAILNILDNSIWWLHKYKIQNKKIKMFISDYKKGYHSIVIADNGKGFTIDTEDAIKPFVTQKNGGIGLGLNIVNEVMISQNGIIDFPNYLDFKNLEPDFSEGAIVSLCFKVEKK